MALTRRAFLAAVPTLSTGAERVTFTDYTEEFRVEAQSGNPRVKCFDLRQLSAWQTPQPQFFTFHQERTMQVDEQAWRLRIDGCVARPLTYTFGQLRARRDVRTMAAVIECSGNSGNPALMNGLVSNGEWTGVPLAALLEESGMRPDAREVVFFGADTSSEEKWAAGGREFAAPHGRSVFVTDAMEAGALLAFGLNGDSLHPEQGYPLRLVIPGWYGMTQVKWLTRIHVLDRRYEGRSMARNYHSLRRLDDGLWLDTSIARNRLKSVVARVGLGRAGLRMDGPAWGGASPIRTVEVRIGRGSWRAATLDPPRGLHTWQLWSIDWPDIAPGRHEVVSRAINAAGEVQPSHEEWRQRFASNREDHSQWVRRILIRP